MALEEFSQDDFDLALKRTIRSLTRGKMPSSVPKAILLGGQSGAGKTTIHRIKQKEFQGNIIIIDGDSYRSQHPNYPALQEKYGKDSVDYTKGFAGEMVEHLVAQLSSQGYHLLIEGTLRTTEVPRTTAQLLKSRYYHVSLALIATKPELSYLSTLIRYEEVYAVNPSQARATPKEYHDGIVEHLVDNLRELETDKLFDQIQIYQRDRSCVYDSETDEGSAADVLQDCLFRKWSKVEEEMMKVEQERLRDLLEMKKSRTYEN
ncbi:type II toxin-antitoxin system toxin PezT [Streptococcus dentapri]|uniref:UDP-N-acetylglucosamine kinase n=1 Tax=Streptococcus dentapri TaxID=573564 RepID=A0ABV8CYT2_9STRE